jgi:hypothetical protein
VADGGRATPLSNAPEIAARRLARALGMGSSWYADTDLLPLESEGEGSLAVARRSRVTEQAARSIDGTAHLKRQQQWKVSGSVVAVPCHAMDVTALGALSFAKLDGPLEAILLLYATGDVAEYWPTVERYGLACVRNANASEALRDAMQRVLVGRAEISQDDRAKHLGVRANTYRELTKRCEQILRRWLHRAAIAFTNAL